MCVSVHTQARQDSRTSADNCDPVLNYSNYAIHCCQKRDKHLWDCIAHKITGDITSCAYVFVGVYSCVRRGLTVREGDMQRPRGGAMVRRLTDFPDIKSVFP